MKMLIPIMMIKHRNNIKECLSHLELFFTDINNMNLNEILTEKNIKNLLILNYY